MGLWYKSGGLWYKYVIFGVKEYHSLTTCEVVVPIRQLWTWSEKLPGLVKLARPNQAARECGIGSDMTLGCRTFLKLTILYEKGMKFKLHGNDVHELSNITSKEHAT